MQRHSLKWPHRPIHGSTFEEVGDRMLQAVEYILLARLGPTDGGGYCSFGDDSSAMLSVR